MDKLDLLKNSANNQIDILIKNNIFKKEWDIKIIRIINHKFLYIDCDTSIIDIKIVKELCKQHLSIDIISRLTY